MKTLFIHIIIIGSLMGMDPASADRADIRHFEKAFHLKGSQGMILTAMQLYLDKSGIIIPLTGHPIYGNNELSLLSPSLKASLKKIKLSWTLETVDMSTDGNMAVCIGKWAQKTENNAQTTGSYCNVWVFKDGKWRLKVNYGLFRVNANRPKPAWTPPKRLTADQKELIDVELAFSKRASETSIPEAFYHNISTNGIAVSETGPPRNREFYLNLMKRKPDPNAPKQQLVWYPEFSYLHKSGEMGINIGPYTFRVKQAKGDQVSRGYFFTVWQKKEGVWRFRFDGGNRLIESK